MSTTTPISKRFEYLYHKTGVETDEYLISTMKTLALETNIQVSIACMRQVYVRMVTAILRQSTDPKKALEEFNDEVKRTMDYLDLLDAPEENPQ